MLRQLGRQFKSCRLLLVLLCLPQVAVWASIATIRSHSEKGDGLMSVYILLKHFNCSILLFHMPWSRGPGVTLTLLTVCLPSPLLTI